MLRNKAKGEEHFEIYGGVKRRDGNENVVARPNGLRETLKLRFQVRDLDLPKRRKRCTGSREEEEDAQMCLCGKTMESRTHAVGECGMYKEERYVLEETRKIDERGMDKLGTLYSSEKTINTLGDSWWAQTAKQEWDKISNLFM